MKILSIQRITRHLLLVIAVFAVLAVGGIAVVIQPFVKPVESQPPQVDPIQLEAHVRYLSVNLHPRSFEQHRKIDLAAQYIFNQIEATGGKASIQEVLVEGEIYKNIVARYGSDTGPKIVIGAHYDSHADTHVEILGKRSYTLNTHTPGADDNASGVAGLLELARLLARTPPKHPVELVAYTLEEPPHFRTEHMGSAWHARSLRAANREVSLMISLEMIGYFSDEPESQRFPLPAMSRLYSDRGNFIALVGKLSDFATMRQVKSIMTGAVNLPIYSINAPTLIPGIDFSDHLSYWNEGIPALMITDTAFLRNKNYHQAGDTYDKLDYGRMKKVVQAVYAITQLY
jgi:Zn-dependent M28 family amino/carboxypeptidase